MCGTADSGDRLSIQLLQIWLLIGVLHHIQTPWASLRFEGFLKLDRGKKTFQTKLDFLLFLVVLSIFSYLNIGVIVAMPRLSLLNSNVLFQFRYAFWEKVINMFAQVGSYYAKCNLLYKIICYYLIRKK